MVKTLRQLKTDLATACFGSTKEEAVESGLCIQCKQPALENCYSESGRKEFEISGLCEKCFDKMFS